MSHGLWYVAAPPDETGIYWSSNDTKVKIIVGPGSAAVNVRVGTTIKATGLAAGSSFDLEASNVNVMVSQQGSAWGAYEVLGS